MSHGYRSLSKETMVMKRRDGILLTSLGLYNARGVASVSNGHVAEEMDISPGSLHYHFNSKLQVVEELVNNFETEITSLLNAESSQVTSIEDLWFISHIAFELQEKYSFVFRDTDYLLKKYPELNQCVGKISSNLSRAAMLLCDNLRASGSIVANDAEVESLATNILLIYTQWLNFRRFYPGDTKKGYIALGAFQVLTLFKAFVSQEAKFFLEHLSDNYRCA